MAVTITRRLFLAQTAAVCALAHAGMADAGMTELEGFLPIFTGLDLRGWLPGSGAWRVEGGDIRGAGGSAPLWSEKTYAGFSLVADLKLLAVTPDTPQGILLRDAQGNIIAPCLPSAPLDSGKWMRLCVSVKPGDTGFGIGPWQIGLSGAGGDVAWRNLFLRG